MANAIGKSSTIKLNDMHLSLMSAGAQREDKCLSPPTKLRGAMRQKVRDKLIEAGLAQELRAKPDMPTWRRDMETEKNYSMKLTAAGMRAVTVRDRSETPLQEGGANELVVVNEITDVRVPTASAPSKPETASSAAPRPGSKIATVLELLGRAEGASLDELIGVTGWLPHTTRAALTGLRKRGHPIKRNRENGMTRYRVLMTSTSGAVGGLPEQQKPIAGDDEQHLTAGKSKRTKARVKRSGGAGAASPSAA